MKQVVKLVKKYGNSGGVYVPAEWIGGKARVELLEEKPEPLADMARYMQDEMSHVVCAIAYGSYARGETGAGSDIDMIIVSDGTKIQVPAGLRSRGYEITVMTANQIRGAVVRNPMLNKIISDEAVCLINKAFFDSLLGKRPKTRNLRLHTDMAESSMKIVRELLAMGGGRYENLAYSLVLRIREMILAECILENRKYSAKLLKSSFMEAGFTGKEFEALIAAYRSVRDNKKARTRVSGDTISKLIRLLEKKIGYVKKKTP